MGTAAGDEADEEARWLVGGGRRWRRQDPTLPAEVSRRLLSHLGRGRSGVRAAVRSGEDPGRFRRRVDLAKHGLGERGTPWWDQDPMERRRRWDEALAALDRLDGDSAAGALSRGARGASAGYGGPMSDQQSNGSAEVSDARQDAVENVVERVESWDAGSEPENVRADLEDGLAEAEVEVEQGELDRMAEEIHSEGRTESPDVG